MVKAQRSWILPTAGGIRWKWVVTGVFAMLGFIAILFGVLYALAGQYVQTGTEFTRSSLASLADDLFEVIIMGTALFLAAFGLGGLTVGWVARRRVVFESVISSLAVLVLLAVVSAALVVDASLIVGILALPCIGLAGLGGWLGELFDGGRTR